MACIFYFLRASFFIKCRRGWGEVKSMVSRAESTYFKTGGFYKGHSMERQKYREVLWVGGRRRREGS